MKNAVLITSAILGATSIAVSALALKTANTSARRVKHLDIIRRARNKFDKNIPTTHPNNKTKNDKHESAWKKCVSIVGFPRSIDIVLRPVIKDILSTDEFHLEGSMVVNDPTYNGDVTLYILIKEEDLVETTETLQEEIMEVFPFIKRVYFNFDMENAYYKPDDDTTSVKESASKS